MITKLPAKKPFLTTRWLASFTPLIALLALALGVTHSAQAASGSWKSDASGLWSATANWTGGIVPGTAAGDTATFEQNFTTAGGRICTNDGVARIVGVLNIGDTTSAYQKFTIAATGGGTLTFDNSGSDAQFNMPVAGNTMAGAATLDTTLPVLLNGSLDINNGSTTNGSIAINGNITANSAGIKTINNVGSAGIYNSVNLGGVIADGGGGTVAIVQNSLGTLTFSGTSANTYSGGTTISAGRISLNKSPNVNAVPGNVTIGNGSAPAILSLSTNGQIPDTAILTLNGTGANAGIFMLNNQFETIGGLASTGVAGIVENNGATTARTLTLNVNGADQTFGGILQDSDGTVTGAKQLALTKTGPNAQIFTGVNTYSGGTIIQAGTLTLSGSGSIASSTTVTVWSGATFNILDNHTVNAGTTLTGAGTVTGGTVTVASGGILAPGSNSVASTLTISALTLGSGSTNNFEFDAVLGTNDLVIVTLLNGLILNGGVFNLYLTNSTAPFSAAGTYNLIQYSGSIGGTGLDSTWTAVSGTNPHIGNPQPGLTYSFGVAGGYLQLTIAASSSTVHWNVNGNGTWNNSGNWSPTTTPNAAGAIAGFGGGALSITSPCTLTLDGNFTVGSLVFNNANSFVINSNGPYALTLDNSGSTAQVSVFAGSHTVAAPLALAAQGLGVTAASGTAVALNGAISGTGGVTNSGTSTGTLALGGANTYSGGTVQNVGTLALNNPMALGTGPLTINGGTLDNTSGSAVAIANNNSQTWNTGFFFAGTTNLDLGNGLVTSTINNQVVNVVSNTFTVGGVISGTNFTKNGNGTLTLGGANNLSGTLTVNGGALNLNGNNTFTNTVTVNAGGTLVLNAAGGALPSSSKITVTGSNSVLNVAQADTISTLTYGTLTAENVIGSGTLTVTNAVNANIAISNTVTLLAPVAGAASVTKTGQGTLLLGAANSYTGGTVVSGANSTLRITNSGTLGSTSGTLTVGTSNSVLDLGGTSQTVGSVVSIGIITNGTLTGSSYTITNGVVYGNLGGSGVAFTQNTTNTVILAGANTYTGPTTISAGTLQLDGSTASGGAVLVTNTGTLVGVGTIGGSMTAAAGTKLAPGDNNVGTLTINGNLTLQGNGALTIAATNTSNYSKITVLGNLNPSGVTSIALPATALPDGNYPLIGVYGTMGGSPANFYVVSVAPKNYTLVYQSGSPKTLVLKVTTPVFLTWMGDGFANAWNFTDGGDWVNPPPTPATYSDSDSVLFDDTASPANTTVSLQGTLSPLTVAVNCNTNSYIFNDGGSGIISGAATLSKSGTNILTINTANSYTGATTISGGTILISADNALGTPPGSPTSAHLVLDGGTLGSASSFGLDSGRGIAVGPAFGSGSGSVDVALNQTVTYGGVIANNAAGTGQLIVGPNGGSGILTLSGANTYTGGTTVNRGYLELQGDQSAANGGLSIGALGQAAFLVIDPGAIVLASSNSTIQIGKMASGLAGGNANQASTIVGMVTNYGTLNVGIPVSLTLNSGAIWNQYGNMTIACYGNYNTTLTVGSGATLTYTGANTIKVNGPGAIYGTHSTLTISGTVNTGQGFEQNVTYTTGSGYATVALNGGTIQLSAPVTNLFIGNIANVTNNLKCTLANNCTIDTHGFNATNYLGITGNGSLIKTGGGSLVMAGTNAYKGNTIINGGTLAIQQPTLSTNSTITVASGAVLELDFAVTNSVTNLVLNGVSQPAGVYNSSTLASTAYADYITGAGSLLVPAQASSNITITNSVSGGIMTLTWPSAQLGWYMQSNSVSLSSPTDWHDVPGSQAGTSVSITLDPTQVNVFYRLSQVSNP